MEFKKKNTFQKMLTEQKELEQYYRDLRKYEYETNAPIKDKEYYEKWYKIIQKLLSIEMKLSFRPVKIHEDKREFKNQRSKIYAVTHVGRYDIEVSVITRGEPAIFLWGDPGKLYKSPEKILIDRVGAIFTDTDKNYREDCHIALKTMIKYLSQGHNIDINSEGAWNILSNQVVMKLYDGTVIAALEGGSDIVPVAIMMDGRSWIVSYGKEIEYETLNKNNIKEETSKLRDELATLKWNLIREYSGEKTYIGDPTNDIVYTTKRESLGVNALDNFINSIMKDTANDYGIEEIEKTRYKDKDELLYEEVMKDLEEYISLYPAFFLASKERFLNYIDTINNMDELLEISNQFREREESQEHKDLQERLNDYKKLKKNQIKIIMNK